MIMRIKSKTVLFVLVLIICILAALLFGIVIQNSDEEPVSENPTHNAVNSFPTPDNTEISFNFLDHKIFSYYLNNGTFRCGSDFEAGEYYIISIFGAEALYGVSDSPNDFHWTYHRILRKITVNDGQYVKLTSESILVPANEIDTNNWKDYGVFLVGKDLPEGDYRIVTISKEYHTDLSYTSGIWGAYQICNDSPENEPEECSVLFEDQSYISVKNGQYVVINNARMTLVGAETDNEDNTSDSKQLNTVETTFNKATNLTKDDLSGFEGSWNYRGIDLLSEDCKWIDNPINQKGTVNQGAMYRKMAKLLVGFEMGINDYKKYAEILIGFVPNARDDFVPYAENAKKFICDETGEVLSSIMKSFENLDCVNGEFNYNIGKFGTYDFVITDLEKCAEELKISEEMLGYILAMIDEYGPTFEFDNNSCHIEYSLFVD